MVGVYSSFCESPRVTTKSNLRTSLLGIDGTYFCLVIAVDRLPEFSSFMQYVFIIESIGVDGLKVKIV